MNYQITHKKCGSVVGFQKTEPVLGDQRTSSNFTFPDGTRPKPYSKFEIYCDKCSVLITDFRDVDRGLDEKTN